MAAAERAGAVVQRPAEEQFYGSRMGTMIDPFGVRWMVATHVHEVDQSDLALAVDDFAEREARHQPDSQHRGRLLNRAEDR